MDNIFELNTVNNVKDTVGASKVKATSPVVEVFSALTQGKSLAGFDGKVVDKATVMQLADIPSKEVLLTKFLGSIKSPLYNLAYALQAVIDKDGEKAPAAEAAEA